MRLNNNNTISSKSDTSNPNVDKNVGELKYSGSIVDLPNHMYNKILKFNWSSYLTYSKIVYHLAIGFIMYLFGASLFTALAMQFTWECFINSEWGQSITIKYLGRDFKDHHWEETLADNLLFTLGWVIGYWNCGKVDVRTIMEQFLSKNK